MKRFVERDFLPKNCVFTDLEVSGYLNKPQHIYEEATCKGLWVSVREDRKYKYNYVTRLTTLSIADKHTQLTASGVVKLGNIYIHNLNSVEVDFLQRRCKGVCIDKGFKILPEDTKHIDVIEFLSSPETIGRNIHYTGKIEHIYNCCERRLITITHECLEDGSYLLTHLSGSHEVHFYE